MCVEACCPAALQTEFWIHGKQFHIAFGNCALTVSDNQKLLNQTAFRLVQGWRAVALEQGEGQGEVIPLPFFDIKDILLNN